MWYNEQFMDHCSWFIDNRHQILHICKPQRGKVLGPAGPVKNNQSNRRARKDR